MSMYEVSVTATFNAAHGLPLGGGKMEESHEHLWETTATFRSRSIDNEMGVVIDFVVVKQALDAIASRLDGKNLNELDEFAGRTTSAENVAERIADFLLRELGDCTALYRVSVTEAPGCSAGYYPGDA